MKKIVCFLILFISFSLFSQEKSISVPAEVTVAFENEFNGITPVWSTDFEGFDDQSQRYIATFAKDGKTVAAYYTKEGVQRVLEQSINIKKLPKKIKSYLKENYPIYKINEAVIVKKDGVKMYEVGLGNSDKFYDAQFDETGYFLQIFEKDKH